MMHRSVANPRCFQDRELEDSKEPASGGRGL